MADILPAANLTSREFYNNPNNRVSRHEMLLKDYVRVNAFKNAILHNKHLFKDKIVLDIGSGVGILSMFAAQAGAKRVIAVECACVAEYSEDIIKANNFEDVITIVRGKLEDIDKLPYDIKTVDIILCDWVGYSLYFESMLTTLIFARDKWLCRGGIIYPDLATLYISAIENRRVNRAMNWWHNVYGCNLSIMRKSVITEPAIETVDEGQIVTGKCLLMEIDLYTVTIDDLTFDTKYRLIASRDDIIQGLITYFDVKFTKCHKEVSFSTSPYSEYTHWHQTCFYFPESLNVKKDDVLYGKFSLWPRHSYDMGDITFDITVRLHGAFCDVSLKNKYRLKK